MYMQVLMNYEPGRVILIHGKRNLRNGFQVHLSDLDPDTLSPVSAPLKIDVFGNDKKVKFSTSLRDRPELIIPEGPFEFEQEFVLAIICQTYGYELLVNGIHFASFEHHTPFKEEMRIAVWRAEVHKIEYY